MKDFNPKIQYSIDDIINSQKKQRLTNNYLLKSTDKDVIDTLIKHSESLKSKGVTKMNHDEYVESTSSFWKQYPYHKMTAKEAQAYKYFPKMRVYLDAKYKKLNAPRKKDNELKLKKHKLKLIQIYVAFFQIWKDKEKLKIKQQEVQDKISSVKAKKEIEKIEAITEEQSIQKRKSIKKSVVIGSLVLGSAVVGFVVYKLIK